MKLKHYIIAISASLLLASCGNQKNTENTSTDNQTEVEQPASNSETTITPHGEIVNMSVKDFNALVSSQPFVVVDFYTTWCKPCIEMAPHLKKIANEYDESQLKLVKIDAERNVALSTAEGIAGYPTLKLYKDGREVQTKLGGMNEAQLRALFAEYL